MAKILNSIHPDDDLHYKKMNLSRNEVALWEDGLRTDGKKGEYEWWYFDSHYPDGTILVIFFFTKSPIAVNGSIKPQATIELTLPDGTKYEEVVDAKIEDSFYSKDKCDIRIGNCTCSGDLKTYKVVFEGKKIQTTLYLEGTI